VSSVTIQLPESVMETIEELAAKEGYSGYSVSQLLN
jgi:metal-responsive CopG/Arc/MetJ family transcriptional regulator